MWDKTTVNLGNISEGSEHIIHFHYSGDIQLIRDKVGKAYQIKSSCGCSKVDWNNKTNTLTVVYKAKPVPKHLESIGEYLANPFITFPSIINQHQEVDQKLSIIATVTNKQLSHKV